MMMAGFLSTPDRMCRPVGCGWYVSPNQQSFLWGVFSVSFSRGNDADRKLARIASDLRRAIRERRSCCDYAVRIDGVEYGLRCVHEVPLRTVGQLQKLTRDVAEGNFVPWPLVRRLVGSYLDAPATVIDRLGLEALAEVIGVVVGKHSGSETVRG